jgi:Ni/Fe-hydrogenase subunit HybB-like protein
MALLPLMLVAYSTLGFVFGIQSGRPGWFSALQAPGFVVLAAISGLGALLVVAALARRLLGLERELPDRVFGWLGNTLGILLVVYVYLLGVEELTARYAPSAAQQRLSHSLLAGDYAVLFWTMIACFVVPLLLLFERGVRRRTGPVAVLVAGVLVNVAALLKRYLVVVPSQTHGQLLPWPIGHYAPTWVELSVATALLALGTLLVLVYARIWPILPLQSVGVEPAIAPDARERGFLRKAACASTFVGGLALAATGLALSARVGTLPYLDPIVPFSPVLFISGVAMTLSTALVYELLPARRAPRAS